jgi:hypothetical protein
VTVISHFFWGWYVFRYLSWVWWFAGAAALPDLPYLALLGYYSWRLHVNGFADLGAWGAAWRSPLMCGLPSVRPVGVDSLMVAWHHPLPQNLAKK